ncbi:MAG TPA: hypothetical protein VKF36_10695 [Syntrophorhabdales bacterium]|nr:hypothetical protein [Syntrophorhabdales bacterium]
MAVVVVAEEGDIPVDFPDAHLPAGSPDILDLTAGFPDIPDLIAGFPAAEHPPVGLLAGAEDCPVDLLVGAEHPVVEDLPSMLPSAAQGAIAEEVIQAVTVEDHKEALFRDTTMEATIIPEDTTEATTGTIIEAMPPTAHPSGFSLAG